VSISPSMGFQLTFRCGGQSAYSEEGVDFPVLDGVDALRSTKSLLAGGERFDRDIFVDCRRQRQPPTFEQVGAPPSGYRRAAGAYPPGIPGATENSPVNFPNCAGKSAFSNKTVKRLNT
jgi:hypothetical protein